ncbi:glutamate 5-kinase [Geothermobacter hydrogeniphilus]|uniref:Glutamate 5-kinase n=1 Tax=Geothermobacter hydrogeniphilus TaxID=1969733 RepID=A0A1X0Y0R4_9BACT|nr:glutamate 5-kinase [Geothermobacter hydrogeniphilus]ORJ58706.1 glutamate 5-kinase [Geothermobacter hydrogeniphilus]
MKKQLPADIRRVVIKIGSTVISDETGLDNKMLDAICEDVHQLLLRGHEVILVSSAAVAAGKADLGISGRPQTIPLRQAAAAIGQSRLMRAYKERLRPHGHKVAQVLLTRDDLANRRRYLNARNTLMTLIEHQVVPIINENDTVVVDELRFGDNDNLSAMTANLAEAGLLVILSDVNGLYDRDPGRHHDARLIPTVEQIDARIEAMAGESGSSLGTGGMATKLKAAKQAALCGTATVILNGRVPGNLLRLFNGEPVGTSILPAQDKLAARKHWIAFTKEPRGRLLLDAGALKAVCDGNKSLLPSGISAIEGRFERGDAVRLCDLQGLEVARGIVNYAEAELQQILGRKSSEIAAILGYKYGDEVVHRDNLVLQPELPDEGSDPEMSEPGEKN